MDHISPKESSPDYSVSIKEFSAGYRASAYTDGFVVHPKLTDVITTHAWSPIIFKDGYRGSTNFLYSNWCVLDFDSGYSIEEARRAFCDLIHIIAPTRKHTPDSHRFRLAIPWERTISDLETYTHNMSSLVGCFDVDASCKDGARMFFPSRFIHAINLEGEKMEVLPAPPPKDLWIRFPTFRDLGHKAIPPRVEQQLEIIYEDGERNAAFFHIACELYRSGYDAEEIEQIIRERGKWEDNGKFRPEEIRVIAKNGAKTAEEGLSRNRKGNM